MALEINNRELYCNYFQDTADFNFVESFLQLHVFKI